MRTATVEHIVMEAKELPHEEQQRLLIILTELLTGAPESPVSSSQANPYAFSLALAGNAHSDFTDVAVDKYQHLAESCRDQ